MAFSDCCFKGFAWDGTPSGHEGKLGSNDVYITGDNKDAAVLYVCDAFGWKFANNRLMADHLAREANLTVYVPDFFGGHELPSDLIIAERWADLDMKGFAARNARPIREPEIFACAKILREQHAKLGAVGHCYGGWACFRLGAKEHDPPLVDCISVGHPTFLTKKDVEEVAVPVQMQAPEIDMAYTAELKAFTFETLQRLGVVFEYLHFPGVVHGGLIRGDPEKEGERAAMVRGKNASVAWFKQFLHG